MRCDHTHILRCHFPFLFLFLFFVLSQAVLEGVVLRPERFSGELLLRTRRRLGVSEVVAGGMHLDVYQSAIQVATTILTHATRVKNTDRRFFFASLDRSSVSNGALKPG